MPTLIQFTSRVLHITSGAALFAVSAIPLLFPVEQATSLLKTARPFGLKLSTSSIALTLILVVTGFINATILRPSYILHAKQLSVYRTLLYGIKGCALLLCTPVLDRIVRTMACPTSFSENDIKYRTAAVRTALLVFSVAVGSACRYYREENKDAELEKAKVLENEKKKKGQ